MFVSGGRESRVPQIVITATQIVSGILGQVYLVCDILERVYLVCGILGRVITPKVLGGDT